MEFEFTRENSRFARSLLVKRAAVNFKGTRSYYVGNYSRNGLSCSDVFLRPAISRKSFCSITFLRFDKPLARNIDDLDSRAEFRSSSCRCWGLMPGVAGFLVRRQGAGTGGFAVGGAKFLQCVFATVLTAVHHCQAKSFPAAQYLQAVQQPLPSLPLPSLRKAVDIWGAKISRARVLALQCSGQARLSAAEGTLLLGEALFASRARSGEQALSCGDMAARKLLAGGLAGAVSKTGVAPLERLTTIMMADVNCQGFRASLLRMWRDGGFWGMFSGNAATLAKIFPQTAIQFASFHSLKEAAASFHVRNGTGSATGELSSLEHLLVGSLAGLLACSATYPLDTMRTQMSITGGLKGNLLSVGTQIVRSQGLPSLYKGFAATLVSDVLGSGLGFMNYEIGTKVYRELNDGRSPTAVEKGVIGALSATATLSLLSAPPPPSLRLPAGSLCVRAGGDQP
uniref:Mitochondrial coenzyme a transporter slc25a42 n=1 Tax=Tetraselmis sp. GSL018 TaxID=582737 RepID=A0A061QKR9_9CHLO|mmetsp:Transcript_8183/g.19601  ORF Transcript_8183/g.19601 Transcript_8183/m.19601 type:complete len:454 (+) Transcript_8183:740-2101(+)